MTQQQLWFTSDLHFGHKNIIQYSKRPFESVDHMTEHLILEWNRCVKETDTVWHLGDFAFLKPQQVLEIIKQLNGRKHWLVGNHDEVLEKVLRDNPELAIEVVRYKEIKHNGQFIVLNHYGQRVWNHSFRGSWHLYGHSHGTLAPFGKSVDVGVDCKEITEEYRPVSFDELGEYFKDKIKIVYEGNE